MADIHRKREERETRKREEEAQKQRGEARRDGTTQQKREWLKSMHGQIKVTQKWRNRGWRRGGHISIAFKAQEGAHDKHLPDKLR